ncbi:MAG: hypothetical protein E6G96_13720, partial [Alphaproteobacteria bacterium]
DGGTLLTSGQTGEVVVRGAGVMPGYEGDPSATAAAFAGDWFKTGDLGFFDDDGYLFLAGRVREIINRGGEKVAPQEIDELLLKHPGVAEAVTFAVPHVTLGEDVASAVVLRSQGAATSKEIRQFAIGRIAEFKIPRQVLIVDKIPKSPTGKVQRIGLAAKLGLASRLAKAPVFVPPRTQLETLLAKHWAEILQLEQIGIHNDFFVSGGDSLLAIHVLGHIYKVTKIQLEMLRFFEAPTIAEVAHQLEELLAGAQPPGPPSAPMSVIRANAAMPASFAQERLWTLQRALPDVPFFNELYVARIRSACDVAILERCINEIVRRHEILRTTFAVIDGQCVQIIAPELTVTLASDDLMGLPRAEREIVAHGIIQEEMLHSFDLGKGPLIRARLLRQAKREHLLLISMHQIICDGWSLGVLLQELGALYDAFSAGAASPLAPLPIQYADFAHWQRHWKSHADIAAQLAYWREQLRDPLPAMQLTKARPTRAVDGLRTARQSWALPAALARAAKRFANQEGSTLFMALVAALKAQLCRYMDEEDIRVATNVANRNRVGTGGLIGPLVNTVILRSNLAGDPTARELLRRVRDTALAAFTHQDFPIEVIAQSFEAERGLRPAALANTMILLQNAALRPTVGSGRTLAIEEADPSMMLPLVTTASFDVILMLHDGPHGLRGTCVYKPHLFSAKTIDRLLRDFQQALESMVTQPEHPISAIHLSRNERALEA